MSMKYVQSILLCIVLAIPASAGAASFRGLGNLGGGSLDWSSAAYGISADGATAVGYSYPDSNQSSGEAFRWTAASGMQGLGYLSGPSSVATAVSANGSVVVGYSVSERDSVRVTEAFRWTSSTGMQGLGDLPGGYFYSTAYGVNRDGSVVVGLGVDDFPTTAAFRWTSANGMQSLGHLSGGTTSVAHGVSGDGSVVVGNSNSANSSDGEAFRWTSGTGMVSLGVLPNDWFSYGNAVSADGSTIVGESVNDYAYCNENGCDLPAHRGAFRWTAAGGMQEIQSLVDIEPPPWVSDDAIKGNTATGVSGDGSVVVGYHFKWRSDGYNWYSDGATLPFIWDAVHGARDLRAVLQDEYGLDLTGWRLDDAVGISADGRTIVGNGTNPSGSAEAWIAVLGAVTPLAGDFNNDGRVDAADFVTWRKGVGTTYTQTDYNTWRAHFGQSAGSGSGPSSESPVPEPSALLLLAALAGALFVCPRRIFAARNRVARNVCQVRRGVNAE